MACTTPAVGTNPPTGGGATPEAPVCAEVAAVVYGGVIPRGGVTPLGGVTPSGGVTPLGGVIPRGGVPVPPEASPLVTGDVGRFWRAEWLNGEGPGTVPPGARGLGGRDVGKADGKPPGIVDTGGTFVGV